MVVAYASLSKVSEYLKPGETFKGVGLTNGWLVLKHGDDTGYGRFAWQMRVASECNEQRERFAADFLQSLVKCIDAVANTNVIEQKFLTMPISCHSRDCPSRRMRYRAVEQCKNWLKVISRMPHTESSGLPFGERMAHDYMSAIKYAVMNVAWWDCAPNSLSAMTTSQIGTSSQRFSLLNSLGKKRTGFNFCDDLHTWKYD